MNKILGLVVATFAAAMLPQANAQDSSWPREPIRIVVPYPAGGAVDLLVRAMTDTLTADLGQPVIVEAKPGGNSNIGADTVANASPDGYTLLASSPWYTLNQLLKDTGRRWKPEDFVPIARYALSPNYMVVGASSSARKLADYVDMARKKPGLLYGSPGVGSTQDMAVALFASSAGVDLTPVPYKGAPPIIPDLVSGQISMAVLNAGVATAQVHSGRVRILASTGSERSSTMPDAPTMTELGYPDVVVMSWFGLHAPAGTSKAIVDRISAAVEKAVSDPKVRERFASVNADTAYQDSAAFGESLQDDHTRMSKAVALVTGK